MYHLITPWFVVEICRPLSTQHIFILQSSHCHFLALHSYTPTCGWCKRLEPVWETIASKYVLVYLEVFPSTHESCSDHCCVRLPPVHSYCGYLLRASLVTCCEVESNFRSKNRLFKIYSCFVNCESVRYDQKFTFNCFLLTVIDP